VVNASASSRVAPRTSAAFPLRSRIATITGRLIGVVAVAISGCRV
jgi:hypothetical protein